MLTVDLEKGALHSTGWKQRPSRMWTDKGRGRKESSESQFSVLKMPICQLSHALSGTYRKHRHDTNVLHENGWIMTSFILLNGLDIRLNLGITHLDSQPHKAFHKWLVCGHIWHLALIFGARFLITMPY